MDALPWSVYALFCATFLLGLWLFSIATHYSKRFLIIALIIIVAQSSLGIIGFYNHPETMTKLFPLLLLPSFVPLFIPFFSKKGRLFIDALDIKSLTLYHIIRVFVEVCLFYLYLYNTIPEAMTFEGRNFDILSGLTAPMIFYFGFVKKNLNKSFLIAWNFACMLLLLSVVSSAALSLPGRYEQFGFERPNIAVGYFPFLLLPVVLVPLALFANAASILKLIRNKY